MKNGRDKHMIANAIGTREDRGKQLLLKAIK